MTDTSDRLTFATVAPTAIHAPRLGTLTGYLGAFLGYIGASLGRLGTFTRDLIGLTGAE